MAGNLLREATRRVPGARRAALVLRFGDVSRTAPLTRWGTGRGTPVDRWYLEDYLQGRSDDVVGRVLEIKSDQYASRLGAAQVEVLDVEADNPLATLVGDLCDPATLAPGRYDAAVVTQTLQYVSDPAAAVRHLVLGLRPGGTLLLTVPCLSRVSHPIDRWRWTPAGFQLLLDQALPRGASAEVEGRGNGLAARAFLFGLAAQDLDRRALQVEDPDYPLIVCARVEAAG